MAGRRIERKLVRVKIDPVTHETHRTILDSPRMAFERCVAAVDRAACKLPTGTSRPWYETAATALATLEQLVDGVAISDTAEPCGTIAREYLRLDAVSRHQFTEMLRPRLREMFPSQGEVSCRT